MATRNAEAAKQELLRIDKNDITVDWVVSKFANRADTTVGPDGKRTSFKVKPPEWSFQTRIDLKKGESCNTKDISTTLGRLLFNRLLIEDTISAIIKDGFFNDTFTKKTCSGLLINMIPPALMEKKIALMPNVTQFIQAFEFWGLMLTGAFGASLSAGVMSVNPEVRAYRDQLYKEAGDNPTVQQAVEIEDKLVKKAAGILADDEGMAVFNSGARGTFDDNYKLMCLTGGPVMNPGTGRYDVMRSNYIDGIERNELPAMGNAIVNGVYPKAIGTAEGGYMTKQFNATFQSVVLDEPGSDCGSKGYLPVYITASNYDTYVWQYAVDKNGKTILMTSDNKGMFLNHVVNLRSPIGCLGHKYCNKCFGERFYKLGIRNVGPTASRLPNAILNNGMKAFHTTKVHLHSVDPEKLLID